MLEHEKRFVLDPRRRRAFRRAMGAVPLSKADAFDECSHDRGFAEEVRTTAFDLVLQLPDDPSEAHAVSAGAGEGRMSAGLTFRLANQNDIATIVDFRCAQSAEYWDLAPSGDEQRLFRVETEAFLRRTLNVSMFFALVEHDGAVVSMSGLEVANRMPTISAHGGAQHSATIVACYTPPPHRGKGFMRRMLSAWTSMAPLLGIDTIYMETHNDSMRHLAQVAGYEHVSDKYRLSLPAHERCASDRQTHTCLVSAC